MAIQRLHNTIQSFKFAILRSMSKIDKDHLIRSRQRFRPRIEAVVDAHGGFIK